MTPAPKHRNKGIKDQLFCRQMYERTNMSSYYGFKSLLTVCGCNFLKPLHIVIST